MTPETETAIAKLLGKRFIARADVKAEQGSNGAYSPVTSPFTIDDLRDHVRGRHSYGHYMISPVDDCTKLIAFDLDIAKGPITLGDHVCESPRDAVMDPYHADHLELIKQLHFLADGLAVRMRDIGADIQLPVTVALAFSGSKGVHVYGWFNERTHAKRARFLAFSTLESHRNCFEMSSGKSRYRHKWDYAAIEIEVYPKQDSVKDKDFGALMRLPLGRNRKTGGRGFFMRLSPQDRHEFRFVEMDPIEALQNGSL